jgi:hypothetical protein
MPSSRSTYGLPQRVSAYTLADAEAFTVTLPVQCDMKASTKTVRYETTVTGVIANGQWRRTLPNYGMAKSKALPSFN